MRADHAQEDGELPYCANSSTLRSICSVKNVLIIFSGFVLNLVRNRTLRPTVTSCGGEHNVKS